MQSKLIDKEIKKIIEYSQKGFKKFESLTNSLLSNGLILSYGEVISFFYFN